MVDILQLFLFIYTWFSFYLSGEIQAIVESLRLPLVCLVWWEDRAQILPGSDYLGTYCMSKGADSCRFTCSVLSAGAKSSSNSSVS
ncbi:hypothetical protein F4780DRAFT_756216 [Xylariomycetidae sp. FL0641]|nr:hypothetical protein F4780DRAFT_756216 [Xylariomycetidae sp. FL0641]